ncbi:hypothetical protein A3A39_00935 [Candidatus Kaiserbacteria bacterium RIFCSPLOWO2_01_FULL_54_13]|uniref:Uncharacterized protein n=1 Tax=Candidatus Kaiserbacteria bacterium RIFCSPLOWO2_01_FULL_54_13 TaxID=1798512 RepID=A0A1F6F1T6_9BACT|nr:MAG: hypothetical protein A3A39_00935 [Candidatus Kaiserbacteria bacterium RIFCSPLOWO2_01_FULL_54_13]
MIPSASEGIEVRHQSHSFKARTTAKTVGAPKNKAMIALSICFHGRMPVHQKMYRLMHEPRYGFFPSMIRHSF